MLSNCYNIFGGMAGNRGARLPSAMLKVLRMKSRITVKLIVSWNNTATNDCSLSLGLPALRHLANLWEDMNVCFSVSQTALGLQSYINKWITWNLWLTYKSHPACFSFQFAFWQFKFRGHQSVARVDLCCWNIYLRPNVSSNNYFLFPSKRMFTGQCWATEGYSRLILSSCFKP